jgi:hypothetical protein
MASVVATSVAAVIVVAPSRQAQQKVGPPEPEQQPVLFSAQLSDLVSKKKFKNTFFFSKS